MRGLVRIDLDDYNELVQRAERAEHRFNTLADFILGDLAWTSSGPYIAAEPVLELLGQWDMDVEGAIEEAKKKREAWANPLPIPEALPIDEVRKECSDD